MTGIVENLIQELLRNRRRAAVFVAVPLLPVAFMLFQNHLFSFIVKAGFFALVVFVFSVVVWRLKGARWALATCVSISALQMLTLLFPYSGRVDISMITWQPLDGVRSIETTIDTKRNSARWSLVEKTDGARPYLYFSMSEIKPPNRIDLSVNGLEFAAVENLGTEARARAGGGYAIPIDWAEIKGRDSITVRFDLKQATGARFFTGFYESEGTGKQTVCIETGCLPATEVLPGTRFIVEVRVADDQGRVIGLLY